MKIWFSLLLAVFLVGCQSSESKDKTIETVKTKDVSLPEKETPEPVNPSELSITKDYGLWLANKYQEPNVEMVGWGGFMPDRKAYNLVFHYDLSGDLQSDKQKIIKYTEKIAKQIFEQRNEMYSIHFYWTGKDDEGKLYDIIELTITRSDWNGMNWESNWTDDIHYFWSGKRSWGDAYYLESV